MEKQNKKQETAPTFLYKLRQNLELCGWREDLCPIDVEKLSDFRRGQISVYEWVKRHVNDKE